MTFAKFLAGAALASLALGQTAATAAGPDTHAAEAKLDASVSSADQLAWLKDFSSAPNHVGSPHDKQNAETTLALFKSSRVLAPDSSRGATSSRFTPRSLSRSKPVSRLAGASLRARSFSG